MTFACLLALLAAVEVDLSGVWQLAESNETATAVSCPIAVPGDVHTALYSSGRIDDPFWGCNETNVQWVAKSDWTLSRTFEVPNGFVARKRIVCEAEDVDTFSEIFLNGEKIGETSDPVSRDGHLTSRES